MKIAKEKITFGIVLLLLLYIVLHFEPKDIDDYFGTFDISRYYSQLEAYKGVGTEYFYSRLLQNHSEPLSEIIFYSVGKSGENSLLLVISALINIIVFYKIGKEIKGDSGEKSGFLLAIVLFYLINPLSEQLNTILSQLAMPLTAYGLVEYYLKGKRIKSFILIAVAFGINNIALIGALVISISYLIKTIRINNEIVYLPIIILSGIVVINLLENDQIFLGAFSTSGQNIILTVFQGIALTLFSLMYWNKKTSLSRPLIILNTIATLTIDSMIGVRIFNINAFFLPFYFSKLRLIDSLALIMTLIYGCYNYYVFAIRLNQ